MSLPGVTTVVFKSTQGIVPRCGTAATFTPLMELPS
jgi:hypothetical protein